MVSKGVEMFLEYIRETEQNYRMALVSEQEANDATQDILHALELEEQDTEGYVRLAQTLREVRQARRSAKDSISQALPVVEWAEENRQTIKGLERLLGAVRKEEKYAQGRIYTPKTTAATGTSLDGGKIDGWMD